MNGMLRARTGGRASLRTRRMQSLCLFELASAISCRTLAAAFRAEHAEELCKWNNLPAPVYGRINQLRIDREEFLGFIQAPAAEANPELLNLMFDPRPRSARTLLHSRSKHRNCLSDSDPSLEKRSSTHAPLRRKTGYIAQLMENREQSWHAIATQSDCKS
jgi:hypothetical protein